MAAAPSFLAPFTGDDLKKRNNTMMNERKHRFLIASSVSVEIDRLSALSQPTMRIMCLSRRAVARRLAAVVAGLPATITVAQGKEGKRALATIAPRQCNALIKAVASAMPEGLITMGAASFGQTVITGHGAMLAVVGDQAQGRQRACVGLAPEAAADRQGYGWILAFIPLR